MPTVRLGTVKTAEGEDGGIEEVRDILRSAWFNHQGKAVQKAEEWADGVSLLGLERMGDRDWWMQGVYEPGETVLAVWIDED